MFSMNVVIFHEPVFFILNRFYKFDFNIV